MMTRRSALFGLLGVAAPLLKACTVPDERQRFRCKLNVSVLTPSGVRTGCSVVEIVAKRVRNLDQGGRGGTETSLIGEAAEVHIGDGSSLLALIKLVQPAPGGDDLAQAALATLEASYPVNRYEAARRSYISDRLEAAQRIVANPATLVPHEVPLTLFPFLVFVPDRNTPEGMTAVDPGISPSFGNRNRLQSITIQRTDEPVDLGIQNRLPWLADFGFVNLPASSTLPTGYPNFQVNVGSFSTQYKPWRQQE